MWVLDSHGVPVYTDSFLGAFDVRGFLSTHLHNFMLVAQTLTESDGQIKRVGTFGPVT